MDANYLAELMDEDDAELFSDLSTEDFQKELSKYAVLRDKNFQLITNEICSPSSTTSVASASKTQSKLPQQFNTSHSSDQIIKPQKEEDKEGTDFWIDLKLFLDNYYKPEEVQLIFQQFQKEHYAYINSLSLDSIERLAEKIEQMKL